MYVFLFCEVTSLMNELAYIYIGAFLHKINESEKLATCFIFDRQKYVPGTSQSDKIDIKNEFLRVKMSPYLPEHFNITHFI
jgi:hypothetical protein